MGGTKRRASAGVAWGAAILVLLGVPALSQTKDLSERTVQVLMDYAWTFTPAKYTPPSGKTIEVDKSKRQLAMVPLDVASEVVRVGRLSAHAQACELKEEQQANYLTMMSRVKTKGTWSDQQLLFIHQLHQTTIMMLAGRLVITEKDGQKVVSQKEIKAGRAETCTDSQRDLVKKQIAAYIEAPAPEATKKAGPLKTGSTPKK
jgi:hypothetical protein